MFPVSSKLFKLLRIAGHPLFNPSNVSSLSTISADARLSCLSVSLTVDSKAFNSKVTRDGCLRVVSSPTMFQVKESNRCGSHFSMIRDLSIPRIGNVGAFLPAGLNFASEKVFFGKIAACQSFPKLFRRRLDVSYINKCIGHFFPPYII